MAGPALPIIAAGSALAGTGINAWAQGNMNKKMRKFTVQRDQWARQNALDDWNMQNAYNSPQAQMQRFRDAGLNPNLIYGQMSEAAPVKGTDPGSWSPNAPNIDTGSAISAFQDAQIKSQTVDNLKKQNDLMETERILKQVQAGNVSADTISKLLANSYNELSLSDRVKLATYQTQAAEQGIRKTGLDMEKTGAEIAGVRANTQYTMDENARKAAMQSYTIQEAVERILTARVGRSEARARIDNMNKDGELKQLDINLKRAGIQPGDPLYMRAAAQLLNGVSPTKIIDDTKKSLHNYVENMKSTKGARSPYKFW